MAQYIKEKLNLEVDILVDGANKGNYLAYSPSDGKEYEYDSETGDLYDGSAGNKIDNIGVIKDSE
ncbi:hypothetical protein PCCS19_44750 [Paenibacillus sp. CCS19]|nr:hypothetical protein PCCS19_44750 [Paenibacillus cellulosilyticus]